MRRATRRSSASCAVIHPPTAQDTAKGRDRKRPASPLVNCRHKRGGAATRLDFLLARGKPREAELGGARSGACSLTGVERPLGDLRRGFAARADVVAAASVPE